MSTCLKNTNKLVLEEALDTNNNQEDTSESQLNLQAMKTPLSLQEMTVSWMTNSTPQDSSDGSSVEPDSNDED